MAPRPTRVEWPARTLKALALASILALPGCVGSGDVSPAEPVAGSSAEAGPDTALTDAVASAGFQLRAPVFKELWLNGTFSIHQNTWPVGHHLWMLGQQPPGLVQIDITEHVPRDIPVRLTSEVHADLDQGRLGTWFSTPPEEHWTGVWDQPSGGDLRAEVIIVHASSEPVVANLMYGDVDPQPTFDYTWSVRVEADPQGLPAGVAVGLEVPETASAIQFPFEGEGESAVMIWDAEDRFMGRFDVDGDSLLYEIGDAPRGTWIVMLAAGSADARVQVVGADAAEVLLETVAQDIVASEPQDRTGQRLEWTFESPRAPLQVGFAIEAGGVTMDMHATLTGPVGQLLEAEFTGGPWVGSVDGFSSWHFTPMGATGLEPGAYRANVEFGTAQGSEPHRTQDFLVYYAR